MKYFILGSVALMVFGLGLAGCVSDGTPALIPNPDPNLNKTSAELAADAAKRHYEADAPRGDEGEARAQYELMTKRLDLVNLSNADWSDVEVWINHTYVLFIPQVNKAEDKRLDFTLFYDQDGHHFETKEGKNPFKTLEVYKDGTMYEVTADMN
jgi:hypothetical protein